MRRRPCNAWRSLVVLTTWLGVIDRADASLINLTESVIGSGTFGSLSFTNQLVSISAIYHTALVVANYAPSPTNFGFDVNPGSITVAVAGIGTGIATPSGSPIGLLGGIDVNQYVPLIAISIENYDMGNTQFDLSAHMIRK